MARNSLLCADVPLRNYSLTPHPLITLTLQHTFTISFQAQNSPLPQTFHCDSLLASTWTAFPDYTGPDLLCSTVSNFILLFFFLFILGCAVKVKVRVKVYTLDIVPLRSESPMQKRSGMARVLEASHSFTCTPARSSAIGVSHTCFCLPSYVWYSFTDPGGMEG